MNESKKHEVSLSVSHKGRFKKIVIMIVVCIIIVLFLLLKGYMSATEKYKSKITELEKENK